MGNLLQSSQAEAAALRDYIDLLGKDCKITGDVSLHLRGILDMIRILADCPGRNDFIVKIPEEGEGPAPTPPPTARHTATHAPSPVPTPLPTPVPSVPSPFPTPSPTAEPTPVPTAKPTPEPTASPTPEPTAEPTPSPTPKPTPHACDDGSHGCDKGPGGICYKVDAGVSDGGWLCDCKEDYKCVDGCDAPHKAHKCELTAAPTPAPTAKSTPEPTAVPTPSPTSAPTNAAKPTIAPAEDTTAPTPKPTPEPTEAATTPLPTEGPTATPTPAPTSTPTAGANPSLEVCNSQRSELQRVFNETYQELAQLVFEGEDLARKQRGACQKAAEMEHNEKMGDFENLVGEATRNLKAAIEQLREMGALLQSSQEEAAALRDYINLLGKDCKITGDVSLHLRGILDMIRILADCPGRNDFIVKIPEEHEGPAPTPPPTARHTATHAPSPVPTPLPTPVPSVPTPFPTPSPTAEPTPVPTAKPTPEPTASPTPEPTAEPTPSPTPKPTPHACDDGSHGCDKGPGGICYKVDAGVSDGGWLCDCKEDYKCVDGCDAPHKAHTCELTAAPTPAPTAKPTPEPTAAPTPAPTTTTTTTTTTPVPVCHEELDLVIVLDGSTSLHADGFEKARGFVQSMVAYLDISPTAARVAVVQYSGPRKYYPPGDPKYEDYGKVETGLTSDRDTLNGAISGMRYVEEGPLGTYTGAALRMANDLLDGGRPDAAKAVLVLFDGGAHDFRTD